MSGPRFEQTIMEYQVCALRHVRHCGVWCVVGLLFLAGRGEERWSEMVDKGEGFVEGTTRANSGAPWILATTVGGDRVDS